MIELTRSRWRDLPQERGIAIDARTDLASPLPMITGVEGEIRDALTNLIFNAVDAMTDWAKLIRQRSLVSCVSWSLRHPPHDIGKRRQFTGTSQASNPHNVAHE